MASCDRPTSDGYDEERFEKEVDSKLQCPICFKVLNEPMQCPNQHYFCRFCIRRHLEENSETCPMCQHHLTEETLTRAPRIVEQFLWSLKIRCDYAARGCPELVELQFLGKHVKDCGFVPCPCTNPGCTELVNHCDKKEHVEILCRFRPVMICEECGEEVLQKFSRFHPCMMKRAMDSLAARINVMNTEITELKSIQQEFMTEVRNMMVGVKAANEDAIHDLERRMTAVIAEAKAANQGVVEELHRKMKVEMAAKEAKTEEEMMYLKKELEETKNQMKSMSKQLELKEVNVKRPQFEERVDGNDLKLKRSANPWRRPRETDEELAKEDKKTAKLYRSVLDILNKLTTKNFATLVQKMMALKIDTFERLEGVVDVIFEKAANEPMYSVVYANLCGFMCAIKVFGPDRKVHSFRKSFLKRCQTEFEKETVFQKSMPVQRGVSCEDKVDQIGEVIERETKNETEPSSCAKQPKLKYERDFLLQFQFIPYCLTKPPGLPDVEIVLDVPNVQNRDVLRRPERLALLPSFAQKRGEMEKRVLDEEAVAKSNKRRLGCIKLNGELLKLKLITPNVIHNVIFKLLRAGDEVSLEGLCSLFATIGKDLDFDKAKPRMEQYFDQINKIIAAKKISSKVRFMLCDVVELRANKWLPRHKNNLPLQTIKQAHTEARVLEQGTAQKSSEQGNPLKFGNTAAPVNYFPFRMMRQSSANQDTKTKEEGWIAAEEGWSDRKDWGTRAAANIRSNAARDVSRQNSVEELWFVTKPSVRKFCDLCAAFGMHDTKECPLLEDMGWL